MNQMTAVEVVDPTDRYAITGTGYSLEGKITHPAGQTDTLGDLLGYAQDLEMTSLVGMVDPPREESKAAVADAQAAHIRVRMVTGDDVITGAAIAKQLNIPGDSILGADFAALSEAERLARIDHIGVAGGRRPRTRPRPPRGSRERCGPAGT